MTEEGQSNIREYDGRLVSSIKDQRDVEAVVKCLLLSFVSDGDKLARRYLDWISKQPKPRTRHAICCVLSINDRIDTKQAPWLVVPENGKCPFPIDWKLYEDPDKHLLVYVQVAFGTKQSVKAHSFHTIA